MDHDNVGGDTLQGSLSGVQDARNDGQDKGEEKERRKGTVLLSNEVIEIIMEYGAMDAKKARKGITDLMTIKRAFKRSVQRAVYKEILIQDTDTLRKVRGTFDTDDIAPTYVWALSFKGEVTPWEMFTIGKKNAFEDVPEHMEKILEATAPFLKVLQIFTKIHQGVMYAFRTNYFPNLVTLEANHHLVLDPSTTIEVQARLREYAHDTRQPGMKKRTGRITNATISRTNWPNLRRLKVIYDTRLSHFDGYDYDLSYIKGVKEIAIFLSDRGWGYNVANFLSSTRLPTTTEAIAVVHFHQPTKISQYAEYRWHRKLAMVILNNPATTQMEVEEHNEEYRALGVVVPWQGQCGRAFWGSYFVDQQGFNFFRVPFQLERLTPPATGIAGDFDETYLGDLVETVNYITGKGATVAIEPHNILIYNGATMTSTDEFQTFWQNLAAVFVDNANVVFDLMNEPHDVPATDVAAMMQAGINGVRAAGATNQLILVEGTSWTGAWTWISSGNGDAFKSLTDPNDNFAIEMHQYLDSDGSGTSEVCVSSTIGEERLADATQWLLDNNLRGFLGEIGAGSNADCITAVFGGLCSIAQSGAWIGVSWWSAGPWWPADYFQSIEPPNGLAIPEVLPQALAPFVQ